MSSEMWNSLGKTKKSCLYTISLMACFQPRQSTQTPLSCMYHGLHIQGKVGFPLLSNTKHCSCPSIGFTGLQTDTDLHIKLWSNDLKHNAGNKSHNVGSKTEEQGHPALLLTNSSLPISSRVTPCRQSRKSRCPAATKLRKPPLNLEIECQVIPPIALWPFHYAWICGICGGLAQLIKIMSWMIKGVLWSADLFPCLQAPASNTSRTSANETEMSLICWAELCEWQQATLKPVCAVTCRTIFHLS